MNDKGGGSKKKRKVDLVNFDEDAFNAMSPRVASPSTLSYVWRLTQDERRGVYELAAGWMCCLLLILGIISVVVGGITMPLSSRPTIKALEKLTKLNTTLSDALSAHLKPVKSEERFLLLFGLLSTMLGAAGLRLVVVPFSKRKWRYCFIACAVVLSALLILDMWFFKFVGDAAESTNSTSSFDALFEEIYATRPLHVAQFDKTMKCSGFSFCCVHNTSEVDDTSAISSYWNDHCALLLPDGTLLDRRKNNITDTYSKECGGDEVPQADTNASTGVNTTTAYTVACGEKIYGVLSLVSYFSFLSQITLCVFCLVAAGFLFTSTVYVKDLENAYDTVVVAQAH